MQLQSSIIQTVNYLSLTELESFVIELESSVIELESFLIQ